MPEQEKSNKIQRAAETSYRFGEFVLNPDERLLTRGSEPLPLTPKAFDCLLCLVSHGGRLVRKQDLIDKIWPSTFVGDANLTNIIVSLRRMLPQNSISTVSKHGYRFMLPVEGEPGIVPELYQTFARAKELALYRSAESTMHARQLLWACLADDPAFALGWAWLGRCCAYLAKFSSDATADSELAEAAFRRAFALDPELACAHQFYTSFEADTGHARQALIRLRERAGRLGCQPETFGGLVQVYRYCGLLAESVDAHQRAKDLDPAIFTSAPHTYFLAGNYEESIQAYSGRNGYYMDAAAWAALGDHSRAAAMLRERLSPKKEDVISRQLRMPMRSLLALMEGRRDEVLDAVDESKQVRDPEILVYLSRHYSYADAPEAAAQAIEEAAQAGFVVAPQTLRSDPWFAALRRQAAFPRLLAESERLVEEARSLL